jgi:hypothetical protein
VSYRKGELILCQRERESNQRHEYMGSIPKDNLDRGSNPNDNADRGSNLKESSRRRSSPKGRYPLPLMSKGERQKH